jgi:hypothetical protein
LDSNQAFYIPKRFLAPKKFGGTLLHKRIYKRIPDLTAKLGGVGALRMLEWLRAFKESEMELPTW